MITLSPEQLSQKLMDAYDHGMTDACDTAAEAVEKLRGDCGCVVCKELPRIARRKAREATAT